MSNATVGGTANDDVRFRELPVPSIVLDSIGIVLCIITVMQTLILILLILKRRQLIKSRNKVLFLLSFNLYISILIFSLFLLDMFISMLTGHLHLGLSHADFDTYWCRLKVYLGTVAMVSTFYANIFQALHRFFRIVYHVHPFLYRSLYPYLFAIVLQIVLGALQPLPVLLTGVYQYEDYHCQMHLKNWRGMILGAFLIWLAPLTITMTIYMATLRYIRHHALSFTRKQHFRTKRDFTVIRRVFWLLIFILLLGVPACGFTIIYYLFGYMGWWSNHLTWFACVLSFLGLSTVQTCFSPHLRTLWKRSRSRVDVTTGATSIRHLA